MWPDQVLNPVPLTYESGTLLTALRGPLGLSIGIPVRTGPTQKGCLLLTLLHSKRPKLYTILAFLSAVWLKGRIFFLGRSFKSRLNFGESSSSREANRKSQKLFSFV